MLPSIQFYSNTDDVSLLVGGRTEKEVYQPQSFFDGFWYPTTIMEMTQGSMLSAVVVPVLQGERS